MISTNGVFVPLHETSQPITRLSKIQIVLKLISTCNLRCTYCYWFFKGDETWKKSSISLKSGTVEHLIEFLSEAQAELGVGEIDIIYHGGEPMMMKVLEFDDVCKKLKNALGGICRLHFKMQTNATLIDQQWMAVLEEHKVFMGVSLDGPKEINDIARVDIRGNSSYDNSIRGIKMLMDSADQGRLAKPGLIAVLNPSLNNADMYRFFLDLGFQSMNYLLPNYSYDDKPQDLDVASIGSAMIEVFDTWSSLESPLSYSVAFIENTLNFFQYINAKNFKAQENIRYNAIIACTTDGDISVDDNLMCTDWRRNLIAPKLEETTAGDFINGEIYSVIDRASQQLPTACERCKYRNLCRGGELPHRYSNKNGFDNPSIYCDGLIMFFEHVINYLLNNGYPVSEINRRLAPGYSMILQVQERVF
ncbi:radical SAM protein [Cellvibrio sp. UBA7671]|uniref:radical SAM protein n=1 Tax=Cellvibrio sp. UBA7671 TaxID=1946312 RepID=UPI002F35135C